MVKINSVFDNTKESATLAINQHVKALRAKGKKVYHFGFGESPFPMPTTLVDGLKKHAKLNQYLPCAGLPELQSAVKEFMSNFFGLEHFRSSGIFIGPGSKELIFQLIYIMEHEVLIPAPSWVSYLPQTMLAKKGYQIIPTTYSDNYCLSPEVLETYLDKEKTQVIILNFPNNPTGAVCDKERLRAISRLCRKYGTIVISDEIYAAVNFSGNNHASIASYYPEGTIVTSGLSKMFSAGGYRLGFACIPEKLDALYQPLKTMISETYSAVATPIQYSAVDLLSNKAAMQAYIHKTVLIHTYVSKLIKCKLEETSIRYSNQQGAFYLLIDFQAYREALKAKGITTDTELGNYLLENYQFAALPGSEFYLKPEDLSFRITTVDYDGAKAYDSFSLNETLFENIIGGLNQLIKFDKELHPVEAV